MILNHWIKTCGPLNIGGFIGFVQKYFCKATFILSKKFITSRVGVHEMVPSAIVLVVLTAAFWLALNVANEPATKSNLATHVASDPIVWGDVATRVATSPSMDGTLATCVANASTALGTLATSVARFAMVIGTPVFYFNTTCMCV
jgi:hypothetical protein